MYCVIRVNIGETLVRDLSGALAAVLRKWEEDPKGRYTLIVLLSGSSTQHNNQILRHRSSHAPRS